MLSHVSEKRYVHWPKVLLRNLLRVKFFLYIN